MSENTAHSHIKQFIGCRSGFFFSRTHRLSNVCLCSCEFVCSMCSSQWVFYKVCFLHPFPRSQPSATNQTTPQHTSARVRLCPAMTCWSLVCFGPAAVWSWSKEEIDEESKEGRENKEWVIS